MSLPTDELKNRLKQALNISNDKSIELSQKTGPESRDYKKEQLSRLLVYYKKFIELKIKNMEHDTTKY